MKSEKVFVKDKPEITQMISELENTSLKPFDYNFIVSISDWLSRKNFLTIGQYELLTKIYRRLWQ